MDSSTSASAAAVLSVLSDEHCRRIVCHLDGTSEPRTAMEIAAATDIPQSTTYRKLDELADTPLVTESVTLGTHGNHRSRYGVGVDDVVVHLDDGLELAVHREGDDVEPVERHGSARPTG